MDRTDLALEGVRGAPTAPRWLGPFSRAGRGPLARLGAYPCGRSPTGAAGRSPSSARCSMTATASWPRSRADDFIVSDRLVSLMMCQVSENKEYAAVFEELIDPEGSELYLKPADEYVEPGLPLSFYTLIEAARRRRDRGRLPRKGGGRRPAEILRRASEPGQVPADNDGRRRQDHRAGRVLAPTRSQDVTDTQRAVDGPNWRRTSVDA